VVGYDARGSGDGFIPSFGGRVSSSLTRVTRAGHSLAVTLGGKGGIPSRDLDAALLDARVTDVTLPAHAGSATLYATVGGTSHRVAVATLVPGAPSTTLVVARPDRAGKVTFSLSGGSAKIVVNGYGVWADQTYTADDSATHHVLVAHPVGADRVLEGTVTRHAITFGVGGVPAGAGAVELQVVVGAGKGAGEVQVTTAGERFGDGSASYLANLGGVQLVSVRPSDAGRISIRLTNGSRALQVFVVGYSSAP
jgi:hypothetical protein